MPAKNTTGKESTSEVNFRKEKKRKCKALFSYQPVNDDELHLDVDDVIDIVEEVEDGWWRGILNGKTGVFPSNFVQELEPVVADGEPEKAQQPEKEENNEIKPKPVRGVGYGNIFQDQMVRLKPTAPITTETKSASVLPKKPPFVASAASDPPHLPPKKVKEQAKVLFSYEACNDDELSLKEGDIINVLSKDIEDVGWWRGELNGKFGVFPDNFVQLIVEDTKPKKPERPEKSPVFSANKSASKLERDAPDGMAASRESLKDKSESSSLSSLSSSGRDRNTPIGGGLANKRLPPDVPKKEENKVADKFVPPLPSKKPVLPPPLKKTGRLSAVFGSNVQQNNTSSASSESTEDVKSSKPVPLQHQHLKPPESNSQTDNSEFDGVESTSEKLVHLTANRVKNPNRRPPSHDFLKGENHQGSQEKANGEVENEAPWMKEMKKNQAKRNSHFSHTSNIKESIHHDSSEDKIISPAGSVIKTESEDNKFVAQKLSSDSFKRPTPVSSPIRPKLISEVDGKDMKSERQTTLPSISAQPTITELAKFCGALKENFVSKAEYQELRQELKDLKLAFETYKAQTTQKILELTTELKDERSSKQEETDRIKGQMGRK